MKSMKIETEKDFSRKLKEAAKGKIFLQSFEEFGNKVPDLHFVNKQETSGWIELKIIPSEKCLIPWRAGQQKWMREYSFARGIIFLCVYVKSTKEIWIIHGKTAGTLGFSRLSDFKYDGLASGKHSDLYWAINWFSIY